MGFAAKSANEVYRYALRLEEPPRSLTDRFCLSLILVNDHSPVCREFLTDYFVDLCYRTADRIRFVFFADTKPDQVRDLAHEMNERLYGNQRTTGPVKGGFLNSLINRLFKSGGSRFSPFVGRSLPYHPKGWRELTPSELHGIDSPEDTYSRLGYEKDTASAVIKPGEAIAFAQRLGIGIHVPCIVIVTDVGALEVEILPFGSQTAAELYMRVRRWVDEFYAHNHFLFDYWHGVENTIANLQREANLALREVKEWRDKARVPGQRAAMVNSLIDFVSLLDLSDPAAWVKSVKIGQERDFPERVQGLCRDAQRHIEEFIRLPAEIAIGDAFRRLLLNAQEDPYMVIAAIETVVASGTSLPGLGHDLRAGHATLQKRITELGLGPDEQLVDWWYRICHALPSETGYKKARRRWSAARSESTPNFTQEHANLVAAIARIALFDDAENATKKIFLDLAKGLGVDPNGTEWNLQTNKYRESVREYCLQCQASAPDWIRKNCPNFTFGDFFPPDPKLQRKDEILRMVRDGSLPKIHPIARMLETISDVYNEMRVGWEQDRRKVGVGAIQVAKALADRFPCTPPGPAVLESVRATLLASLQVIRAELEEEVNRLEGEFKFGVPRRKFTDPQLFVRLHSALDEYDTVVNQIRYPHRDDTQVLKVRLSSTLLQAVGVDPISPRNRRGRETLPAPKELLKDALDEARRERQSIDIHAAEIPSLPPRYTPAARLAEAISITLTPDRLEEILPTCLRGELNHRLREALAEHRVRDTLGLITDTELSRTLEAVSEGTTVKNVSVPRSRLQRIELILSRIGADIRPSLFGEGGLLRQLDDLDAQINGLGDQEVTFHGTELRRSLEQYLKQFVAVYGPMTMSPDERYRVPNQTLGPLTNFTLGLLNSRNSHDSTPPLKVLADKVREAREIPGWLDTMAILLPRLTQLSNVFPHHIINGVRELQPAERLAHLTELSQVAREVAERLRDAKLYPICLRFTNVRPDSMYTFRFEFESDPPIGGRELVAFSQFPPDLPGLSGEFLTSLYRQTLLMLPIGNPDRLDPFLVPAVGG